jgi:hypothetical protein
MSFLDAVGHIADVTAVPGLALGFGLTFWQLRKTRTSAEAARDASRGTQLRMNRVFLLTMAPSVTQAEDELTRALHAGERDRIGLALQNWRC